MVVDQGDKDQDNHRNNCSSKNLMVDLEEHVQDKNQKERQHHHIHSKVHVEQHEKKSL